MRRLALVIAALFLVATMTMAGRAEAHTICESSAPGGTAEGTIETVSMDAEDPVFSVVNQADQLVFGTLNLHNLAC